MSDIHALSGAYAVHALDDNERTEFEQHLAVCAECRAEVASLRETAALLAGAEAETPPESLRQSVLAGISQVRPLPPETPSQARSDATPDERSVVRRRRRRLPQLLAAAAAVVLLAVGAISWHPWQHDRTLADRILNAGDAVSLTKPLPGGGELILVRSLSIGRAVLVGRDVPEAGAGKTYQMWLQQPGQDLVPAGLVPDADQPTVLDGDAATATTAAVSIEPAGGSEHPSQDVVAVFVLKPGTGGNGTT